MILVLSNKILVLSNKILVLFDKSIRISLARTRARIHKVFYPCNRCHLATLLENQCVTCGNEVTRVTTNGNFALNIHSTQLLCSPKYGMRVAKISQFSIPPHGTNRKVPPPWVEGAASEGRRCRLRGSKVPPPWVEGTGFIVEIKNYTN